MYVGTQGYVGANAALRAIETMRAPVFEKPAKPTKEQFPEQEIYDGEIKLYFDARLAIYQRSGRPGKRSGRATLHCCYYIAHLELNPDSAAGRAGIR